mgnify:FL=1
MSSKPTMPASWLRQLLTLDADSNGEWVTYSDHACIVAEAGAAVFAFHPEWTVTGMCDSDCLACRRLTELITEREKGYEEGKADAEQAHAAALAEAVRESAAHHYRMGKARGADLALNYDVGDEVLSDISAPKMSANDAIGDILRFNIDSDAAAPRTLTTDDRPDYKWDQEEVDDLRRQGYERGLADARAAVDAVGRWRSFPDDTLLSRAAVLAAIDALIHDGVATT